MISARKQDSEALKTFYGCQVISHQVDSAKHLKVYPPWNDGQVAWLCKIEKILFILIP